MLVIHRLYLNPYLSIQASLWIAPPTVRNVRAGDLRSAVTSPRLMTFFSWLCTAIPVVFWQSLVFLMLPNWYPQLQAQNYASVHQQKGCFSHKHLSFKKEKRLSQRALVDSSFLSLDQCNHMTGKETQATVIDLSPIMIHPLGMGIWSFPLQHKF